MDINDNLIQLAETKSLIKDAIRNKGVAVSDDEPFRSYVEKINSISGGGSSVTVNKSNFVLMGNPTYENGTLKDITTANYGLIPSLTLQSGSWEYEVGFKTGSTVSGEQYMFSARRNWDLASTYRYGLTCLIEDGRFDCGVGGPSSWYADEYFGNPQPNTRYKIKVNYNGNGTYTFYLATEDGEYVQMAQRAGSAINNVTFVNNMLGAYGYNGTIAYSFKGEIYPKDFVFRNNGQVIYQCVTTLTVSDGDWV